MSAVPANSERYIAILVEYDQIMAHALAMSARLVGCTVSEKQLSYAETIFTKLLCHAISLRRLCPTLEPTSSAELWDIGAICAVARTLVEAFDALAYIGLHAVPPGMRDLRFLVWELHSKEHRLHMLEGIGAAGLDVETIKSEADALRNKVKSHAAYDEVAKNLKKLVEDGKAPAYLQSKKDRNIASGVNYDFYNSATMFLSQYVHTTPFALSQLVLSQAGDPEALQLITNALQYTMAFLSKTIEGIESLWPDTQLAKGASLRRVLGMWRFLAEQGVKGAGR